MQTSNQTSTRTTPPARRNSISSTRMKRREFLRRTALAAGCIALTGPWLRAAESQPRRFDPFETVTLGKSGIRTSRFSLGTGMRGGNRQSNHTRMGREKLQALIRESYERGTRLFDLADLYVQRSWLGKDVSYSLAGATVSRPARSTPDLPRNFEPRADSRDTCTFGFPKHSICRAWENLTPCPEKALERAGSGTARDTTPVQGRCLAARLRALARRPGRERPGLSGK